MNFRYLLPLGCLAIFACEPAVAQATDMAAERSRIANQRIQAEAERMAREEEERQRQAEAQARAQAELAAAREAEARARSLAAAQAAPQPAPAAPAAQPVVPAADMSKALEQIRTLGELKDAGYVTDEEFARIKNRILDSNF